MNELLRRSRSHLYRFEIAVAFGGEGGDWLAGLCDAVSDPLGPIGLGADDDSRRDVGIAAGADQSAEEEFQISAELEATIRMRQRQCSLNQLGDAFSGSIGKIIHGQDHDVVTDAVFSVLASKRVNRVHRYCLALLRLWTWTCSPGLIDRASRAYRLAIFYDWGALCQRSERDFVSQRDFLDSLHRDGRIVFEVYSFHRLTSSNIFDCYADMVFLGMH